MHLKFSSPTFSPRLEFPFIWLSFQKGNDILEIHHCSIFKKYIYPNFACHIYCTFAIHAHNIKRKVHKSKLAVIHALRFFTPGILPQCSGAHMHISHVKRGKTQVMWRTGHDPTFQINFRYPHGEPTMQQKKIPHCLHMWFSLVGSQQRT